MQISQIAKRFKEQKRIEKKWQWYINLCQSYIDFGSGMDDVFKQAQEEARNNLQVELSRNNKK